MAGKYRVERVIGAGGVGQVVSARHVELGNLFAIKVLHPTDGPDDGSVLRFMREAQAIARIQNDHVVRVHDVGKTDSGLSYIVMEHLDGQDLGALLAARGPLPVDEAVGAILEACEGLAEAHDLGIVHRDLKPQNLFLARKTAAGDAIVKVVDFGLAKSAEAGGVLSAKATMQGEIVGTGGYIAPEQMAGEATARSDVWALGVTLYRLLTGRHPFAGKNAVELSVAALTAEVRPLSHFRQDVPSAIEGVVQRCLRKLPEERYADARMLADALLEAFASASQRTSETVTVALEVAPDSITAPHLATQAARLKEATQVTALHHARVTPRPASTFARKRDEETTTLVDPRRLSRSFPEPTPPAAFTMEEGRTLDPRSRLMLLASAAALGVAILFLVAVISWRRSAREAQQRATEPQLVAAPGFPPPPPIPPLDPIPTTVTAPPPTPVVIPPPPLPTAPPSEAVAVAAPDPSPTVPTATAPTATAPTATAPPEPPPATAAVEPSPPPVPAPAPAPKKPAKRKGVYDTP